MNEHKLVIGLTGLYASGKSTVAELFIQNNFYEIDVDKYGHKALKYKQTEIVNCFGKSILNDNGGIDRKKLGRIVFSSKEQLDKLNKIVHPYMKELIEEDLNKCPYNKIIINAALLIPMKLYTLCDKVIGVLSDEKNIIKRGMERDNRTVKDIKFILSTQPTPNQITEIADFILMNNEDISNLKTNSKELINKIIKEYNNG